MGELKALLDTLLNIGPGMVSFWNWLKTEPALLALILYAGFKWRRTFYYYIPRFFYAMKAKSAEDLKAVFVKPLDHRPSFGFTKRATYIVPEHLSLVDCGQLFTWIKKILAYHGKHNDAITLSFIHCCSINWPARRGLEKATGWMLGEDQHNVTFVFHEQTSNDVASFRDWMVREHARLNAKCIMIKIVDRGQYINSNGTIDLVTKVYDNAS